MAGQATVAEQARRNGAARSGDRDSGLRLPAPFASGRGPLGRGAGRARKTAGPGSADGSPGASSAASRPTSTTGTRITFASICRSSGCS